MITISLSRMNYELFIVQFNFKMDCALLGLGQIVVFLLISTWSLFRLIRWIDGGGYFYALFTSFTWTALYTNIGRCSNVKANILGFIIFWKKCFWPKYHFKSLRQSWYVLYWRFSPEWFWSQWICVTFYRKISFTVISVVHFTYNIVCLISEDQFAKDLHDFAMMSICLGKLLSYL